MPYLFESFPPTVAAFSETFALVYCAAQGDYKGIMVVVTPCRSDRSTLGLLPYSHLNDGRLHVILIRSCSVLQYLRFLASIPQRGTAVSLGSQLSRAQGPQIT